jgi:ssDNA-binding Zn-finger/Zn-ribbon topoisomerase 1
MIPYFGREMSGHDISINTLCFADPGLGWDRPFLQRNESKGMNLSLMQKTVDKYVCSTCWGRLLLYYENSQHSIRCANYPDCTGRGYVTKYYASRRLSESANERGEVKDLLTKLGILQKPKKSEQELLKELGF